MVKKKSVFDLSRSLTKSNFWQVMVDTTEVIFGTVKFIQPFIQTLAIANTGQV